MASSMEYDDVAWEKSDNVLETWQKSFYNETIFRGIGNFILKHRGGVPEELCAPKRGSFNVVCQMKFKDGGSAIIRFPCPGRSMFPEEKVRNEVAIMRYLAEHTRIPVPFILHWGMKEDSPCGLGPFIIMEYIEHDRNVSKALNTPGYSDDDRPVLDPNISIEKLEYLYGQIADILLQLSRCSFSKIGAPAEIQEDHWEITKRPLSLNMNELIQLGNYSHDDLPPPTETYSTSSAYYSALARMHIKHLESQKNDAIDSAEDCRHKYISRHLFYKLADGRRLGSRQLEKGPFKLFCDDLRPANILINADYKIVGVIDWEFTYAAPLEFAFSPPWWLLLEKPENWSLGLENWVKAYETRLPTFLQMMEKKEREALEKGKITEEERLSDKMRESWESGSFWVNYAARKSWAFDGIFWKFLDKKFFGEHGSALEERLSLLTAEEAEHMEPFVENKVKEMNNRTYYD